LVPVPRCPSLPQKVTHRHSRIRRAVAQLQQGVAANTAVARCRERLACPSQRKDCRRGLDYALLIKAEISA
jgi:hypothetical protein